MADIFIDTAGWAHMINNSQAFHTQASAIYRNAYRQGRGFITTSYIITELVALLTSPIRTPRMEIIDFVARIKASPHVGIVHIDATTDTAAWSLLTRRQDKDWSLVDCSSFVIMQQLGLTEALTTDHHFEQAGFVLLLK